MSAERIAAETSATAAIRQVQDQATSLATLVPRYLHALHVLTTPYYRSVVRTCLAPADAAEAERDDAWPNLLTELRRAHHAGRQPERALAQAVREALTDPQDHLLDRRITEHLTDHPSPALTGVDATTSAGRAYAWTHSDDGGGDVPGGPDPWTHLVWTMKAAENHGTDPTTLLPAAPATPEPSGPTGQPSVIHAWLHAQDAARRTRPGRPDAVLPWAPAPVPGTVTGDAAAYLTDIQHLLHDLAGAAARAAGHFDAVAPWSLLWADALAGRLSVDDLDGFTSERRARFAQRISAVPDGKDLVDFSESERRAVHDLCTFGYPGVWAPKSTKVSSLYRLCRARTEAWARTMISPRLLPVRTRS